jgi:hypothetical protein
MPGSNWGTKNKSRDAGQGPSPGDFPIGSLESRAAARAALDRRTEFVYVVVIENIATGEKRHLTTVAWGK